MTTRIILPSLLAALFFSSCQGGTLEEIVGACMEQFPSVTKEIVIKAFAHEYELSTKDEKCLANCFLINSGLVKNNEISVESWDALHNLHLQEKAQQEIAHQNTLDCKQYAASEHEPCEYAGKLLHCFLIKFKESKLPSVNLYTLSN